MIFFVCFFFNLKDQINMSSSSSSIKMLTIESNFLQFQFIRVASEDDKNFLLDYQIYDNI